MKKWLACALLIALLSALSAPLSAQTEETMTIRFYILPIERSPDGILRWAKYFASRYNGGVGITADRNMIDYGTIDLAVLVSNISDTDHAFLAAQTDVFDLPLNLDVTMSTAERGALAVYLEAHGVPGDWIGAQDTWRTALRTITSMFLYMQRLTAQTNGVSPLDWGYTLNTQWRNVSAVHQAALSESAVSLGYDVSFLRDQTQIRALLKNFADQWGAKPIYMGMATL